MYIKMILLTRIIAHGSKLMAQSIINLMNNRNLFGFFVVNSIAGSMSNSLREQRMELEMQMAHITTEEILSEQVELFMASGDIDGAYEYLNCHFKDEIFDAAQNQQDYVYSLETLLEMRKDKYTPFYERIARQMPEYLSSITADDLCDLVGVKNLHIVDKRDDAISHIGKILLVTIVVIVLLAIISVL